MPNALLGAQTALQAVILGWLDVLPLAVPGHPCLERME